ncbi:MAG TPA: hypothetical protein VJP81_06895 [Candidatus Dormibacteraeota bacterium]|nr:hypothetical protein [Candidatus Dormibacteraeota bacterium]
MTAFLANVGVNAGHAARSPLFEDGTFRLLSIPENAPWRPPMVRLDDVAWMRHHAPASWRGRAVHVDPDLTSESRTYGDNCRRAGRAFSLRRAQTGDLIVFLARLQPIDRRAEFRLVGCLEIDDTLRDVVGDPGSGWWDSNAHVRRGRATEVWDSFWVFKGNAQSRLFERAVAFGRQEAQRLFGDSMRWLRHRTELQTIGSCTRPVRRVEGAGEEWLRATCRS